MNSDTSDKELDDILLQLCNDAVTVQVIGLPITVQAFYKTARDMLLARDKRLNLDSRIDTIKKLRRETDKGFDPGTWQWLTDKIKTLKQEREKL